MDMIESWAGIAADLAAVLALGSVIAGFIFGWRQFRLTQASQRELHAKSHFIEFLKLSLAYPALASYRHPEGQDHVPDDFLWFSSLMLNSFEHILDSCPDREWERTVMNYLQIHRLYLSSSFFNTYERPCLDAKLLLLIDRVVTAPVQHAVAA